MKTIFLYTIALLFFTKLVLPNDESMILQEIEQEIKANVVAI